MKSLSETIGRITRTALKGRGFGDTRILTEWESIVGRDLAANSMPVRVRYPQYESGEVVLQVKVNSGWNLQFSYLEPMILEKISTFFGSRLISKLHIITAPVAIRKNRCDSLREDDEDLSQISVANFHEEIKDSALADALTKLGKRVAIKSRVSQNE